ncbi:NADP-dependent oxidoreductase [Nonomuraea dietziae]
MRAISQEVLGGPEVLTVVELDRPMPGPTDVLVRVHAAGVNPTDWLHRASGLYLGTPPFVLGWDVSGVVEAVGAGVTLHKVGEEVFGMLDYPSGAGAYAEYVSAPSRNFARKPAGIDHIEAAALPVAALTAWQALVDTADLQPGQRVLIHAAAGGVGHLAVQLAKALGAYVIGTASASKHDCVRSLGADEVIDYSQTDFARTCGTSTSCSTPSAVTTAHARWIPCGLAAYSSPSSSRTAPPPRPQPRSVASGWHT